MSSSPSRARQILSRARQPLSDDHALADPAIYYGKPTVNRLRRVSFTNSSRSTVPAWNTGRRRRGSHDEPSRYPRSWLIDVDSATHALLSCEDTDNNHQITIEDKGPKVFALGSFGSDAINKFEVRGTYMLSNLLQELTIAQDYQRTSVEIHEARLNEIPVYRLARRIQNTLWDALTRCIDGSNIDVVGLDPKDWTENPRPRIYVPRGAPEQYEYFTRIAREKPKLGLDVRWLSEQCADPSYVRDLNNAPGLLAIAMEECQDPVTGKKDLQGLPFVVPGGRFNELYGWDSYMESLGLILCDRVKLAQNMVTHFCFCVKHYGMILNANRSYYLCRSQPPFLTDMALRVYDCIKHQGDALDFLREATCAAIKEYYTVWMSRPRYDPGTGLSRYHPGGLGVPPETEPTHFEHLLAPYAQKHGMTFYEFIQAYNHQHIDEPELNEYFLHDRAVRESGHDTSYRLEKVAANLAVVDVNALLYKYEVDIGRIIRTYFDDKLSIPAEFCSAGKSPGYVETSAAWEHRARSRRVAVDEFLWNEERGMYFDYDTVKQQQTGYESATTLWPMWAGLASPRQAALLVKHALPKLEMAGGLAAGTEHSRGEVSIDRPSRQWDYPFGWAPQQMLAWTGLERYGYKREAQRLAYRWCYMITKAFYDYNGVVVEKYDVTRPADPHRVDVEYGNQGRDFKGVPREGFGWVNASYLCGLDLLDRHMLRVVGLVVPWEDFVRARPSGRRS